MSKSVEDFYKQLIEDIELPDEEKAALFSGTDENKTKLYLSAISETLNELNLTEEEEYIHTYNLTHIPKGQEFKTAYETVLFNLVSLRYIHSHKEAAIALFDPDERKRLIKSVSEKDLEAIGLDPKSEKVEALLKSETPGLEEILEIIGSGNAFKLYDRLNGSRNEYRTKAKAKEAGAIVEKPKNFATPTIIGFSGSLGLYHDDKSRAYLAHLSSMDGLKFKDGKLFFESSSSIMRQVSEAELRDLRTNEGIEDIDISALRYLYSIIFYKFQESHYKQIDDIIAIHAPILTKRKNPKNDEIDSLISKIQSYHNIMGVIKTLSVTGKPTESYYQVLNFEYYDREKNIIAFSSPYMNLILSKIWKTSIKRNQDNTPKIKKNGDISTYPSHSYLIKTSMLHEKNKAAVENVFIIVSVIERAGDTHPHIGARTLIERNLQLSERFNNSSNKTVLLNRIFKKTWELLRTQTRLQEVYKDIELPDPTDPANIPTMGSIDQLVFEFNHKGKHNDDTQNE
ncbi:MAG: hypothetical protein K6E33_09930 [Lachnospiraceae bacterium]|nr:hypothetical protein [Lachnospiraceae bacterium]